jgi:8-amino-7-oxononanoate synthase
MSGWEEELARRLADWRAAGLERRLRVAEGRGVELTVAGRRVVSFASNDYLGLSSDPRVAAAAREALEESGAGATASRLLCGTRPVHAALEADLAAFKRSEAALVFASGYQAALAALAAPAGEDSTVLADRLVHACLIDGARLSGARMRTFRHNNVSDLREALGREAARRCMVVVESLYSMDGDIAPLAEMIAAAREHSALILVDEAHATGVLGPGGRGLLAEVLGEAPLPADVLAMGTLSKALGSQGGFLCASGLIREVILHSGRAFLFSTGLAPAAAGAAREALRLAREDEPRRQDLLRRSEELREELTRRGWRVGCGEAGEKLRGPILPLWVGDENRAARLAERLFEAGYWVPAIRYPTVRRGTARLRLSLSALHTGEHAAGVLAALDGLRAERT